MHEEIRLDENKRASETRSARAFVWIQFFLGAIPGWFVGSAISNKDAALPSMFVAGLLALSAIIVGFVVTLMLFTGSVGKPEILQPEQLKRHIVRVKYLLNSQITTLVFSLAMCLSSLVWLGAFILNVDWVLQAAVGAVSCGLLVVALARTLLLPYQIYELHTATFADLLAKAAEESRAKYKR